MTRTDNQRGTIGRNPLDILDEAHLLHEQMCATMEQIADGLPDDVDRGLCAQVASCLQFDLPLHHQDEEAGLFPILRLRTVPDDGIADILDKLMAEHVPDADLAAEISEALDILAQGKAVSNPNMVGYMLRGFFERYRRHVHWENVLVMPLARRCLTPQDLDTLSLRMDLNRSRSS